MAEMRQPQSVIRAAGTSHYCQNRTLPAWNVYQVRKWCALLVAPARPFALLSSRVGSRRSGGSSRDINLDDRCLAIGHFTSQRSAQQLGHESSGLLSYLLRRKISDFGVMLETWLSPSARALSRIGALLGLRLASWTHRIAIEVRLCSASRLANWQPTCPACVLSSTFKRCIHTFRFSGRWAGRFLPREVYMSHSGAWYGCVFLTEGTQITPSLLTSKTAHHIDYTGCTWTRWMLF